MSCPDFIANSFALRTSIHLLHLASRSYAEHIALNEFYDAIVPLVDQYAEVYQGANARIAFDDYPSVKPPVGTPIVLLEKYTRYVREEQKEDIKSQSLLNILAEIEALASQTLYKLRFLA